MAQIDYNTTENMRSYGLIFNDHHEEYEPEQHLYNQAKDMRKQQSIQDLTNQVDGEFTLGSQIHHREGEDDKQYQSKTLFGRVTENQQRKLKIHKLPGMLAHPGATSPQMKKIKALASSRSNSEFFQGNKMKSSKLLIEE